MQVNIYCKDLDTSEIYSYKELDCKNYNPFGWIEDKFCDNPTTFNLFTAKGIINKAKEIDMCKSQYKYYIKPIKKT